VLAVDGTRAFLVPREQARRLPAHVEQFPLMDAFRGLGDAVKSELKARAQQERRVPMWRAPEVAEARA
jgi:hypothetical protein